MDQEVPFVDPAAYDFRLTSPIPGSDGSSMGAGTAGIVADAAAMPPVFTLLRDAGEILTLRNGDLESVERDGSGKAVFIDFDMTGERVAFAFDVPLACADSRDCADLVIRATPLDGSPAVDRRIRVPVSGSGSSWSVAETALVLGWAGIERPAKVRWKLAIGSSDSAEGCWSWEGPPYHIGEYAIPPAAPSDLDGDGTRDACDNCAAAYNPDQANADGDRKGDACDPDDDNDGLSNAVETNTGFLDSASDTGTDPRRRDTDGDGYSDRIEVNFGSDPFDAGSIPEDLPTLSGTGLAMLIGLFALLGARLLRPRSPVR